MHKFNVGNSLIVFIISVIGLVLISSILLAQTPPASQTAGAIERRKAETEKQKALIERIEKEKPKPEEEALEEIMPEVEGERILVKRIVVEGAALLSKEEIRQITSQFEGKQLSLVDMQKIADLITDAYRVKGYATSRAYLPPQTIREGILMIRVIEGRVGAIDIKGNRYFKTPLLKKKIKLRPHGLFDYSLLQKSLVYINEHPDRTAKTVLAPGREPGTTDIIIEVEDNYPFHISFGYDNWGSRYIEKDRFSLTLEHNNFLGFDDKIYFKWQKSEASFYELKNARYLFPVNDTLELGAYVSRSKMKLGREFEDVDSRGKATIIGIFLTKAIIAERNLDLRFNFGFDYKRIRNFLAAAESSRDDVRVFKGGLDLDIADSWGRTIFTSELDIGIPRMFGGLSSKDPASSRSGAGGKFFKGIFNILRLQPAPFSSTLLLRNTSQCTNYNLVASEQFQIGGPTSVRGFPPGEYSADKGTYSSIEWSFPPYFISKNLNVPFTKEKFYDDLRFVLFYDWATTHLNKVLAGERKHRTLKGWGYGVRLNLKKGLSLRVEFGYPIHDTPSDEDHVHPWVEFNCRF